MTSCKLFHEKQELIKRKISNGDVYNAAHRDLAGECPSECPQKCGLKFCSVNHCFNFKISWSSLSLDC